MSPILRTAFDSREMIGWKQINSWKTGEKLLVAYSENVFYSDVQVGRRVK